MAAHDDRLDALTLREREVLDLVRRGLTNEEIAHHLGITLDGAKYHVSQILSKFGVASREEAAALAESRGWPLRRLVGATVVIAALAGIGLLAWSVLANDGGTEAAIDLPVDCGMVVASELERGIYAVDLETCERIRLTEASDYSPAFSPDGERIVFVRGTSGDGPDDTSELFTINADGTGLTQLTNSPGETASEPSWSADGTTIAYSSWAGGVAEPLLKVLGPVNPSSPPRTLMEDFCGNVEWSPRGTLLAAAGCFDDEGTPLYVIDAATGSVNEIAHDTFQIYVPRWSPDGSRIAYWCSPDGSTVPRAACVINADGSGRRVLAEGASVFTTAGDVDGPAWTSDGSLVAYADGEGLAFADPDTGEVRRRIDEWQAYELTLDEGVGLARRCFLPNLHPCTGFAFLVDLETGTKQDIIDEGCFAATDWSPDRTRLVFSASTPFCY